MAIETNGAAKIRAVIFDYGEVLCNQPLTSELDRLAGFFGTDRRTFKALWDKNRGPYDRGDMSAAEYWALLAADAAKTLNADELAQACRWDVEMWAKENREMVAWLKQLRRGGFKTAILSNIHPDMIAYVRKSFDWLDQFDFKTFSAEVRRIKPEPEIYEHTLRGLGVQADEALFVDDKEVNVRAAKALGIQGLQFFSMDRLRRDLEGMGFPVLPGSQ